MMITATPGRVQALSPMMFKEPMVKAIYGLAGIHPKTQTRRVIEQRAFNFDKEADRREWLSSQPLRAGDYLWVRETYKQLGYYRTIGRRIARNAAGSLEFRKTWIPLDEDKLDYIRYCDQPVTGDDSRLAEQGHNGIRLVWATQTGLFMPKKYARTFLRIKRLAVERLHDITEEAALAEGSQAPIGWFAPARFHATIGEISAFAQIWQLINGKRPGCTWKDNPYVKVIEFERVQLDDADLLRAFEHHGFKTLHQKKMEAVK